MVKKAFFCFLSLSLVVAFMYNAFASSLVGDVHSHVLDVADQIELEEESEEKREYLFDWDYIKPVLDEYGVVAFVSSKEACISLVDHSLNSNKIKRCIAYCSLKIPAC